MSITSSTNETIINEIITTASNTNVSVYHLLTSADTLSKLVMFILLIISVWSWSIMIDRFLKFKILDKKILKFENLFWSGQVLDHLYEKLRLKAEDPLSQIFVAAIGEWHRDKDRQNTNLSTGLRVGLKERIMQTMELIRNKEIETLASGLNFLATVGSSSTFIGLFGTVWGIMHSFQSIAASKNTTLAVVAPGIAEALLATLIGLFAAIPAIVFYNYLSVRLSKINSKIDDFIIELHTLISRAIDEERV